MVTPHDNQVRTLAAASANFGYLIDVEPLLVRYGVGAERHLFDDPNVALFKMRQYLETIAQRVAAEVSLSLPRQADLHQTIQGLQQAGLLTGDAFELAERVRRSGNRAVHRHLDDQREALACLQASFQIGLWFHQALGLDGAQRPTAFVPPANPQFAEPAELADLRHDLEHLRDELARERFAHEGAASTAAAEAAGRQDAEALVARVRADLEAAFALALESEQELARAQAEHQERLDQLRAERTADSTDARRLVDRAIRASARVRLSESQTRAMIDEQLRAAGWEADSENIRHSRGTRPVAGRNMAIAEWPTASGLADYVLFCGLEAVAAVEAKPLSRDVAGDLEQAKRYCRDFEVAGHVLLGGPWGPYRLPLAFSTNGRAFLRQLRTASGLWFADLRRQSNRARPRRAWPTPEAVVDLLAQNSDRADAAVAGDTGYPPRLRRYQRDALHAIEQEIADGSREMLVAMATGTGKTVTCLGLIERLLRNDRFRRILFLVDRLPLGEQVEEKFKNEIAHGNSTLDQLYEIATLGSGSVEATTRVHIATIQSMVKRILDHNNGNRRLDPDLYDCIIIDECHRGYTLDKELSSVELEFRDESEYQSAYRRALDHFDAVKIGLTATPAAHTTQIFGSPIFTYSYRQAVVDGYLVDHEPPTRIHTEFSTFGIHYDRGTEAQILDLETGQLELHQLEDELNFDVDDFNRRIITPGFNLTACRQLAQQIIPGDSGKTIIFCVNDAHADLVVDSLRTAMAEVWGDIDNDVVLKITSKSDRPGELIRRLRNERTPQIAVTVDLLTTGVDIPHVTSLVFMRRVRSRILFEQMLGRATRLAPEIGKELFHIFDAVGAYEALEPVTAMRPVVKNVDVTTVQLTAELSTTETPEQAQEVSEQLAARLQRRLPSLTDPAHEAFIAIVGMSAADFIDQVLRQRDWRRLAEVFRVNPELADLVDEGFVLSPRQAIVHDRDDTFVGSTLSFGAATTPAEYLARFQAHVKSSDDDTATGIARRMPWNLTYSDIHQLAKDLGALGFTETALRAAVRETSGRDFSARLIGYIRHFADAAPLLPFDQRVDSAVAALISGPEFEWTPIRRSVLLRISTSMKAHGHVDHDLLNDGQFRQELGGYARLNVLFGGQLARLLARLAELIWTDQQ
ncbi:type I restriction-modification system endonuclease [Polymorphospora rubra]|uniref:type I restriction-modification system endonuclease n=1 Tax=Polymorphospora rubra TaxID=338584 RepID=UPI0033FE4831